MVPRSLGVTSAKDLDGATVCIQTGTTTELNLADYFRANNITYEPVPIETNAEALQQYLAGACDAYTTDASGLAASRATFENPADHTILPEIISKEPLGPLVRHGDNEWADIVRWSLNMLIAAEELGHHLRERQGTRRRDQQPRNQPDARHRGRTWRHDGAFERLGREHHRLRRQLRRDCSSATSARTPRSALRAA